jgi:putative restriction endonuclease
VKAYVGVTDIHWYRFLSKRTDLREVNFWRPYGSRVFRVLTPGEPFVFKTKHPQNAIVGGAIFEGFVSLTISRAWEFFGEGNGVASIAELIDRLCGITGETPQEVGDREIGCVLLRDTWFLGAEDVLPAPRSFSANIVQGKSYDVPGEDSSVDSIVRRILNHEETPQMVLENIENLGPTHGSARIVIPRLGQGGFKAVVQEAYERRCAVTNHKITPTLQAAHILPVASGGEHRIDNGVLLRSDVHTLFDRGYLGINPDFQLLVSPRLRSDFGNGDEFYAKEGQTIGLPSRTVQNPSPEFLSWHLAKVFH